jgi:DNA-directed RNA polymerase subunit RPC12/RpoP
MPPPLLPDKSPPPVPEIEPKGPPAGRKFPCRQCGAKLDFDPEARGLKCPYCGFTEHIPAAEEREKASVQEHDLDEFLAKQEKSASVAVGKNFTQVRCGGCGAVVVLEDRVATDKCPYCSTHLENEPEAVKDLIPPESLLPFSVSDRDARDRFNKWIAGLWFAPTELKQLANLGQFGSVYTPYWTYDAMTYTSYTGERGVDYWEEESYTDNEGRRQTRQVRKTRWYPVSGEVRHFFDDVLIPASQTLPGQLVGNLAPWHLKDLEPFRAEFLSGHVTERYAVSLKEGFRFARNIMEDEITGLIYRDIGGDHQRVAWRRTNYLGVTFKHALLPVWVANYRYRDKLFHVLVNGRSGRVAGERPWSWLKIARLVLLIIFAILLALVLVNKAKGKAGGRASTLGQAEFARSVERFEWESAIGTPDRAVLDGCATREWRDRLGVGGCAGRLRNRYDNPCESSLYDPNSVTRNRPRVPCVLLQPLDRKT